MVDGSVALDRRSAEHVQSCLRCQAELAQYRRLLRVLGTMRAQRADPPPGLLASVLARLEEVGEAGARRAVLTARRAAYLGALAAATAAGAAGALVLAARRRQVRLAG